MKKNRNLWLYLIGRFVSLIGTGIQMIALPLYILDKTGSGTLMGVFSMLTLLPALVTAPLAGIIGDRKNRKNVMIVMDIGRAVIIGVLGILAMGSVLNIYILFIAQVVISMMDSMFGSSSSAIMPDLISNDELMKANSLKGGFDAASMILGPALGGVIYGAFGITMVFYINAASFIVCAICSFLMIYHKEIEKKEKVNGKVFFKENGEALKFIFSKKGLLQLFIFAMFSNFICAPIFDIIMPFVLKKKIGFTSQQFGYLMCFFTVGVLLGNIFIAGLYKKFTTKFLMRFGLIIETIVMIVGCWILVPKVVGYFGGATWILFSSIACSFLIMGISNAIVNTPLSTNLQKMVPDAMRSRFFSLLGIFSQCAVPLGSLIYGILLDRVPYAYLLLIINILSFIVTATFLLKACDEAYEGKPADYNGEIAKAES